MTDSSEPSDTAATADDGLEGDIDVEQWRAELEDKRAEKDEFFAQHPQSPVPPEERDDFAASSTSIRTRPIASTRPRRSTTTPRSS